MLENFLSQTTFSSQEDFLQNFHVNIPENFNFAYDVVDRWAEIEPNKPALLWTDEHGECRQYTFADVKLQSDLTASYLYNDLGIRKGDMVMLILKRNPEFWFSILALHKIGAITIPATHLLTPHDIIYRVKSANIRLIVCAGDEPVLENIKGALPELQSKPSVVSIGPNYPDWTINFHKRVLNAQQWIRPENVNTNDDVMLVFFTSGTTGEPKMVAHDFTYPLAHIVTAKYWHNLDENSLHFTLADTGWGKAVWGKLYGQWLCGANVFVYHFERFRPADILKMFEKYHITSFCAPPTVFRFLLKENIASYDISSLKYCTIAGEALNPSVFDEWKRLTGISLMEGFGQTETTLTIATYPWVTPRPGAMGIAGPQYDVDILTPDGSPAKPNEEGEIVVRTHGRKVLGLFKEYLYNKRLTDQALYADIYHTGDLGKRDKDGYFYFIGRKDDVIKSSGYRIGPTEVENAVMTHPAVMECAVIGVPDEIRGQLVKAYIILAKDYVSQAGQKLVEEIQKHVKKQTAPYKYPRLIEFVEELPKTISGKIRHSEIRDKESKENKAEK